MKANLRSSLLAVCLVFAACEGTHSSGDVSSRLGADKIGTTPVTIQFRIQNLSTPPSPGESVCAEYSVDGGPATRIPLVLNPGYGYYYNNEAILAPAVVEVDYFVASDPACTSLVRPLWQNNSSPRIGNRPLTACAVPADQCGDYSFAAAIDLAKNVTPAGAGICPGSEGFADANGDFRLDICDDACPSDSAKTEPGLCGCGVADVDENSNGQVDCEENLQCQCPSVDLSAYATLESLGAYATVEALDDFVVASELDSYPSRAELANYATAAALDLYATKAELGGLITYEDLAAFAQPAMSASCPFGQSVSAILPDGSVECSSNSSGISAVCPDGYVLAGIESDVFECVPLPVAAPPFVTLTQENYRTIEIPQGSRVFIDGVILLDGPYDGLEVDNLSISGGGFEGTGAELLELGDDSEFRSVEFALLDLDGGNSNTFANCNFDSLSQADLMSDDNLVQGGNLSNTHLPTTYEWPKSDGLEIRNSTVPRISSCEDCNIRDSTLGDIDHGVDLLSGSVVYDSWIRLLSDSVVSNNEFNNSYLDLLETRGLIVITGNKFSDTMSTSVPHIDISPDGSWYLGLTISGNSFEIDTGYDYHIRIQGTSSSSYQSILISNNNFLKGDKVLGYSGSLRTAVLSNVARSTVLGVSSNSYLQVLSNAVF